MQTLLSSPARALLIGLGVTAAILLLWLAIAGVDPRSLLAFLLRWIHVLTALLWVGMIWFVNFIQFAALRDADDQARATLHRLIVPRVTTTMRHMSHVAMISGILLLITSGYLLDRLLFSSAVYIPPLRNWLLWAGTIAGLAMWIFLHFRIWPSLKVVLGDGSADAKTAARDTALTYARINLILALPVTFVMVAAAHLY